MFRAPRSCRVVACGLPLLLAFPVGPAVSAAAMVAADAPADAPADVPIDQQLSDTLSKAEAARRARQHAEAADLYAEAYRLTTTDDTFRNSEFAADAVIQAATAYRKAFAQSDDDYSLCRRSKRLLDTFRADWEAAGKITPNPVFDELRWVEKRLEEDPETSVPPPVPVEPPTKPPPADDAPDELEIQAPPVEPEPTTGMDDQSGSSPSASRILGIALLAGGGAVAATGAVLLGVGIPLRGRSEQYRTDTLASPGYMELPEADQQVATEYLDRYVDDERRRGVTLMATGGAVLGVGVAAVVVGAITLARAKRDAPGSRSSSTPRLRPRASVRRQEVTLGLRVDF
ncbi:MAG: hypothetical protein AAGF11_18595 [Myxococcota bacterium]